MTVPDPTHRPRPLPPRIELIYDAGCPNVDRARGALRQALAVAGESRGWSERVQVNGSEGSRSRHPSPTILIDGRDPFEGEAGEAAGCRLYENGSPSVAGLVAALAASRQQRIREKPGG
ncbi:MAG: hypothetical protein ACREK5_03355 [Gemmatimonadota bacterium]